MTERQVSPDFMVLLKTVTTVELEHKESPGRNTMGSLAAHIFDICFMAGGALNALKIIRPT